MEQWWTIWWAWAAIALVLAILEVILPGYIFLGFAGGAVLTALVAPVFAPGLPTTMVVFAIASAVTYIALRKAFGMRGGNVKIWDRDIND